MGKKCDFYVERSGKDYCALKNEEISYSFYRDYCYRDDMKQCPIFQFYEKNK